MRLRRLDLTRYGKFTGHSVDFGEPVAGTPDLHVVYGLNEAGKSTALSAYLDLLFGIEERSRYGFLHPYNAMEIGACLELDGAGHELVRRKQRSGSLVDKTGRPLAETLLAGALSGLTRDAYRTMFSLDDATLEEGGNAILQSRGDLGELLFSASAGLSHVGAALAAAAEEADAIFKKRARSTVIAGLKQTLNDLKARRDDIDTAASTYAALVSALSRASDAYDEAMREKSVARSRLDETGRRLRARPLADEYARLRGDLAGYAHSARPPAEWGRELPKLAEAETRLRTQIAGVAEEASRLGRELDGIAVDERLLALFAEIAALAEGMARFMTADEDLPRRRLAMVEREAAVAGVLGALGQAGHDEPPLLLLSAPLLGTLRDLIEARSGIDADLRTAERELAEAAEARARAHAEADRLGAGGAVVGDAELAGVAATLERLRRSDAGTRLRLGERELAQRARRWSERIEALSPWTGDAAALRALDLPDARRVEAWRGEAAAVEKRRAACRERLDDLVTQAREQAARLGAIRAGIGPIDDARAAELRAARDAAWTRHCAALDAAGAAAFAEAMAADDRIGENRLARTQELAELRTVTQAVAVSAAAAARQAELLAQADADLAGIEARIGASLPVDIGPPPEGPAERRLDRIESWTRRRGEALEALEAMRETQGGIAAARQEGAAHQAELAEALTRAGVAVAETSQAALAEAAEALIAEQGARRAARAAAEKEVREREGYLASRRRDFGAARAAMEEWRSHWDAALEGTWVVRTESVGGVREILDALAALPAALRERDDMRRRIDTMEHDRTAFATQVATILGRLGEDLDPGAVLQAAADLAERRERAGRDREIRDGKLKELDRLEARKRGLHEDLRLHEARKGELTAFFGVESLAEASAAFENAATRARIEARIAELGEAIAAEFPTASREEALAELGRIDIAETEREGAELAARLDDLDARAQALFAEKSKAADRLASIGGDDAVARLQAERRTVLLHIEDQAMRYLKLRTGALVAQGALRAYRDRHRSSMMKRASQAFAAMTRGDYAGLSARPEKDRETLIGLPRAGGSKLATDMSKGTRFQLYLALRLAGYEEFALARRPVPFVADDIMETFDEPRSEEVFQLLSDMSRIGQVVYLTHHRHLCVLASKVEPAVRIHEI